MSGLTPQERETLNAAEEIIKRLFDRKHESLMMSFHAGWNNFSVTYFTPSKVQHGSLWACDDPTFAGKIEVALAHRADEENRADEIKVARIEALRNELAGLTGEVA